MKNRILIFYQFFSQKSFIIRILILIALIIPEGGIGFTQVKNAWVLGDGEKVFREDVNHPDKKSNYIWDGKTIRLKGLYNEVLAFQLIAEVDRKGATAVEISVQAPVERASNKTIGANTLKYGPQGTIEVFSEHYLHVIDSTAPNWFYGSVASQPKKMSGWIPDALIPSDAKPGLGGFPLNIPPINENDRHLKNNTTQNQGFWIDIHLPRDQKNFPAGTYFGTVELIEKGSVIEEFPLEITLLPYYLPDENRTNVWLFSGNLKSYFPELSQENIDNMIKFEAHRHRIDMAGGFEANSSVFNLDRMDRYKPYLEGAAFTPSNGYNGPGEGSGEKLFPIGMYGAPIMGNNKEEVQIQSDLWVNWFKKNALKTRYFWYLIDEPGKKSYAWIKERAGWIKSNPGPGKALPVFVTTEFQEELSASIDIWAEYDGVALSNLDAARKNGGDYWFYNGNRPRIGSVILEGTAVDFRVNSWILYKYGINEWFIWEGTHWQHNSQGPKGRMHQNVFINPNTFMNESRDFGNGDGIVFYPGRMPFYPDQDRGLNQLIPSIRLKNIRRGQQDALIMWMAEQKIGKEKVISLVNKVLPKAMSEVEMTDKVYWSEHGSDYDRVRDELLKIL